MRREKLVLKWHFQQPIISWDITMCNGDESRIRAINVIEATKMYMLRMENKK